MQQNSATLIYDLNTMKGTVGSYLKAHLTPNFFSAEMKLCNIHIKNLIILSVSGNFEGLKIDKK